MHENRNPVKSLNTELEVLNILNKIYDDGKEEIAGKIATSIRVICKDTSRCKSLLFQTNLKDQIIFSLYSGLKINTNNPLSSSTLCQMAYSNSEVRYLPLLDEIRCIGGESYESSFNEWWEQGVIKDNKNEIFTRKELIETICEKEGGAHYDIKLKNKYKDLFYNNSMGHYFVKNTSSHNNSTSSFSNKIHFATIRHISYELNYALVSICKKLNKK